MSSGRRGGQRDLGRASRQRLALDAGGQRRASRLGAVAAEGGDAVQDPHYLNMENMENIQAHRKVFHWWVSCIRGDTPL